MALRTYISTTLTSAAQAEGVSEDFYFLQHLNQAAKGNSTSLAVIQSVRTAANTAGDTAATELIDAMLLDAEASSSDQSRRVWVDLLHGDDSTGNGSLLRPFATLEAAMDTVSGATTNSPWTIYVMNGDSFSIPVSFKFKANVFVVGISAQPIVIAREDFLEIENDGNGDYYFNNILFVSGLKIATTSNSSLTMKNCQVFGFGPLTETICFGDISGSLAGKYFLINTPLVNYAVVYRVNGIGDDPGIPDTTVIFVDLDTDDDDNTVASKTVARFSNSTQPGSHAFDFTLSSAGGSAFDILSIGGTANLSVVDVDTGFIIFDIIAGQGLQVSGTAANKLNIAFENTDLFFTLGYFKHCNGYIRNCRTHHTAFDWGSTGFPGQVTMDVCSHTTIQLKGNGTFAKRGNSQSNFGSVNGVRLINRISSLFPVYTPDSTVFGQLQRRTGSLTSGSDILTLANNQKIFFQIGCPLYGPGIPPNTFIGDSFDLPSTQVRMVDTNGDPVNATQTRSDIFIGIRRASFESGALTNQYIFAEEAAGHFYFPITTSNWPSDQAPNNVGSALDCLASRKLFKEQQLVDSTDITNQYLNLTKRYMDGSVIVNLRRSASGEIVSTGIDGATLEYIITTFVDTDGVTKSRLEFGSKWADGAINPVLENDILYIQGLVQDDKF